MASFNQTIIGTTVFRGEKWLIRVQLCKAPPYLPHHMECLPSRFWSIQT